MMTASACQPRPGDATLTAHSTGPAVWDRLWRHEPDAERDAMLLDAEERGPRFRAILDRLVTAFGGVAGLRTIELGSGRGDVSVLLARRGARVTLVDYSDRALDRARDRFDRLGLSADLARADLLGDLNGLHARFDASISYGVVEHFRGRDRTRVIDAHRRVLRRGGVAIISVPNAWCPTYRLWKAVLTVRGWWPYGMEVPYTRGELTRRARRAGLERLETPGFGFRQSVHDHLMKGLLRRDATVTDAPSRLDHAFGAALVLFGWTPTGPSPDAPAGTSPDAPAGT